MLFTEYSNIDYYHMFFNTSTIFLRFPIKNSCIVDIILLTPTYKISDFILTPTYSIYKFNQTMTAISKLFKILNNNMKNCAFSFSCFPTTKSSTILWL